MEKEASETPQTPSQNDKPKPKRGGSKPILKVSGIGRVENPAKATLFAPIAPINQKNYYTDYLKRDDQIVFYRELNERLAREKEKDKEKEAEREREKEEGVEPAEEEPIGARTIVLHPGSRNLRIGTASMAYPKTVPNVIAHRVDTPPSQDESQNGYADEEEEDGFEQSRKVVQDDLITRMRFYKRRILPSSSNMATNFNARTVPEEIPDHNDPYRVEWTDVSDGGKRYYTGTQAVHIPPNSSPKYTLKWPIQNGCLNEYDYESPQQVLGDISLILVDALEEQLSITFRQYRDYNVVLLVPDLYDRSYLINMVSLILGMGFANVCVLQEAMGATFGAGISTACIIDIGAQKTSICCVEEGMVVPDSRVLIRYGGDDITRALARLLKRSEFPYRELDISRQYDWELVEDLKKRYGTTNDADVAVQLYNFYQRAPGQRTRKYQFKTFDEVMVAPLGLFYPQLFENNVKSKPVALKMSKRYSLFPRSVDIYENRPNDPISDAQINVHMGTIATNGESYFETVQQQFKEEQDLQQSQTEENSDKKDGTTEPPKELERDAAQHRAYAQLDQTQSPSIGLDHAIIESVTQAAKKSAAHHTTQNFYDSLMVVGGSGKFSAFSHLLTDRIMMFRNAAEQRPDADDEREIQVMPIPREMDPEIISWKGGSVYAKLKIVNENWVSKKEWDLLGARCLQYKVLFLF
ncbi:actin-like protein Arp8p [Trichomonascus vanleenenianus]|uniref:Arp8p n=1 Tax=Trichomonascus vanleenenianus TaxID=2268995 RepID=UPI003EC95D54